jgi:hypothetical protein
MGIVRANPLDERAWFELTRDPSDEEVDQLLELADEILDVSAIATGPEMVDGTDPKYALHRCVGLVLEALERAELAKSPQRASLCLRFARAGILSPVTANRRRSMQVLGVWPLEPKLRVLAIRDLVEFATRDPDQNVREAAAPVWERIDNAVREMGTRFPRRSQSSRPLPPWPKYIAVRRVMQSAFPSPLTSDVEQVASLIPPRSEAPRDLAMFPALGSVMVSDESVALVGRVYLPEPDQGLIDELTDRQKVLLSCWYSQSSDGYVRQKHLTRIIAANEPWVVPFVLRLMGEYVWEIADAALPEIAHVDRSMYQQFAEENPEFMARIRSRVVSYRRCYWYDVELVDYPGYRFLERLGLWQDSEGRRLLKRAREGHRR